MVPVAPPRYQRRPGVVRPPRASPAPTLPSSARSRSRSRSATPGGRRRCTHCNQPTLAVEEGATVCQTCGVVVEQDGNFRAEAEFDETSAGGIQLRGTHVRGDQTHQKQYTNRVAGASHVGLEGNTTYDNAFQNAKKKFKEISTPLQIGGPAIQNAEWLFKQAYRRQFYRGRTLESVAIVCLYLAVRRLRVGEKETTLMLIDFAEASVPQQNVFELGKMAKELQKMLYLTTGLRNAWLQLEEQKKGKSPAEVARLAEQQESMSRHSESMRLLDPEDLIERFCDKLDFGEMHMRVKKDAVMVAKSMNRDWMTTGRRPAGIAGAAVIIAARMNNYRRTLREVVLVAKVTEITLSKRIEEFKETKNSEMSIQEFRAIDHKNTAPDGSVLPPSAYRRLPEWQEKQAAKKKKRKRKGGQQPETAGEIENGEEAPNETEDETEDEEPFNDDSEQPPEKRPRIDAEGFAIPALPVRPPDSATPGTPSQSGTPQPQKRKVGKPKGSKNWQPPPPTEAEIQEENELTEDIQDQLRRNASLDPTGTIAQSITPLPQEQQTLPPPGSGVTDIYPKPRARDGKGPAVDGNIGNTQSSITLPETLDDEFDDDPDVANCVLSEPERVIKETIWVTENADWLRTEHAKKIKRELKDRELREKGIDPDKERLKKIRRKDGMLRAGVSGDIAYLKEAKNKQKGAGGDIEGDLDAVIAEGQEGAAGSPDAEDAEQDDNARISMGARSSVQVMLQQRGTFSRRVDYDKLSQAYVLPGFEDSTSESRSESPAAAAPVDKNNDRFFRQAVSKGAGNSNVRRAKQTTTKIVARVTGQEPAAATQRNSGSPSVRSRSRSKSASAPQDVPGEEDDAEFEADEGTPEISVGAAAAMGQLPTPQATQTQAQRRASQPPRASPMPMGSGASSPLSSTHTPAGYGSGAPNTPQPTQTQPQAQLRQRSLEQVVNEDDDDDEEDDDEDEDEDEDVDPDVYFGGGGGEGAETMLGEEEEVVDDEF